MYIKTFKYPTDNSMISFKKDYDSANSDFNSYQLKVFQEILVNRYIDVVKSKFGISSSDIDLNVTSTVEDNKSYLLYSLVFKTLTHSQISLLTPQDFLINSGTTPEPEPDEPEEPGGDDSNTGEDSSTGGNDSSTGGEDSSTGEDSSIGFDDGHFIHDSSTEIDPIDDSSNNIDFPGTAPRDDIDFPEDSSNNKDDSSNGLEPADPGAGTGDGNNNSGHNGEVGDLIDIDKDKEVEETLLP